MVLFLGHFRCFCTPSLQDMAVLCNDGTPKVMMESERARGNLMGHDSIPTIMIESELARGNLEGSRWNPNDRDGIRIGHDGDQWERGRSISDMILRSKGSVAGGIGSRKGRGPTKWGGPQAIEPLLCVGSIETLLCDTSIYIVAEEIGNSLVTCALLAIN